MSEIRKIEQVNTFERRRELIEETEAFLIQAFHKYQDLPSAKNYRILEQVMLDFQHAKLNIEVVERVKNFLLAF